MESFVAATEKELIPTIKLALFHYTQTGEHVTVTCLGVSVDSRLSCCDKKLLENWRQDYNFFSLTWERRRLIQEYYIGQGKTIKWTSEKLEVSTLTVSKYVHAKGWARSQSETVEIREQNGGFYSMRCKNRLQTAESKSKLL